MRFTVASLAVTFLFLLGSASPSFGLSSDAGRIVKGRYEASGKISVPGVRVAYLRSRVSVNIRGRIRGRITRVVSSNGRVVERSRADVNGKVRNLKLRSRQGTFTAPAVVRIKSGSSVAIFRGSFNGLSSRNQRFSRFFRGKINGVKNSRLLLRSR